MSPHKILRFVLITASLQFIIFFSTAQVECNPIIQGGNNQNLPCGGSLQGQAGPPAGGPFEFSWSGPNGFSSNEQSPIISQSGSYTLTITGENCISESSISVQVISQPLNNMANAGSNLTKCAGETIAFNIPNNGVSTNSNQNGTGPYTYSWSPTTGLSDANILNPSCFATNTTTYTLTVTDANGCSDTDQMTVTVTPSAVASLTPAGSIESVEFNGIQTFYRCGPSPGNFQFSDPIGGAPGSTYSISWGDGTPNWTSDAAPNPVNHLYSPGLYNLTYVITEPNGCIATVTYQIFYGTNPAVGLGNPGNTNVCNPETLQFPITGTAGNALGTQYTVTFNDGSPPVTFNHPPPAFIAHTFEVGSCGFTATDGVSTFQNAFSANIVAVNPCGTSSGTIVPITVNTSPESSFTINPLPNACTNSLVSISSQATGVEITPSGCNTNPPLVWTISPANGWSVSAGALGNASGFDVFGDNWDPGSWVPGSNDLGIVFNQPGTYTIEQLVGISCGFATSTQEICIEPPPTPNFSLTPLQGCSPLTSSVSNNSMIDGCDVQFEWEAQQLAEGCPPQPGSINFNSNSYEPNFVFNGQGSYEVTLTLTNSCGSFAQTVGPITVNGPPIITQDPLESICAGQGCVSPSATTEDCGLPVTYNWSFPGGTPTNSNQQIPGEICYNNQGTYTLTATATNSCGSSNSPVTIDVYPIPEVSAGEDITICLGTSAQLNGSASGGSGTYQYSWSPTSGLNSSSIANPIANVQATTTYTLTVTDSSGCIETDEVTITVNQPATANANGPYSGCAGFDVNLTANTSGPGEWSAPPGTGSFLDPSSPNTVFTPDLGQSGTTITLTWTTFDPDGDGPCTEVSSQATVTVNPPAEAEVLGPYTACSNAPIEITALTNNPGSWATTGNGTFSNMNSAITIYTPSLSDVGTEVVITWTTIDPDGPGGPCIAATNSNLVLVNEAATATVLGPYEACGNEEINVSATANGIGSWSILSGQGTFSDVSNTNTTFQAISPVPGTLEIMWTTADPDGDGPCEAVSAVTEVSIQDPPDVGIDGPYIVCSNGVVAISATTNYQGQWSSSGNGVFANSANPATTYSPGPGDEGTIELTWTTINPIGPCEAASASTNLIINQAATADIQGPYVTCGLTGIEVQVASSINGTWSTESGAGSFLDIFNPTTTFTPSAPIGSVTTIIWTTDDPDGDGPCEPLATQTTVQINAPAEATISGPFTACSNLPVEIVANSNTSGVWTSSGGGVLTDPLSAITTYVPADSDFGNTVLITWTTDDPDGDGPCQPVQVQSTIEFNPAAEASVNGPFVTCGSEPIEVSATASGTGSWSITSGNGSFENPNNTSTIFTPLNDNINPITITWTTDDPDGDGPCQSVSDSNIIEIFEPAFAEVVIDELLCSNEPIPITVNTNTAGTWTTNGDGQFDSLGSTTTLYTPSVSDASNSPIQIIWTTIDPDGDGPCISVTDIAEIAINAPPVVDAGSNIILCLNTEPIELVGSPLNGTWEGNGVSSNGLFNPNQAGIFPISYSFTDENGCSSSDEVILTVNDEAIAIAGGPYATCGAQPIQLNATTNGTGTWSGGNGSFDDPLDPTTVYTPSVDEVGSTITLQWETFDPDGDGPCDGAIDSTELTISTPATAEPGGPYTICSSDIANIEVITTPGQGSWSGGLGDFGTPASATTTYTPAAQESATTVVLTWTTVDPDGDGPCLPVDTQVTINVLEEAIALAGGPYATCGAQPTLLSATTNGTGTWTGGNGSFENPLDPTTVYTPSVDEVGSTITLQWETFDPDGDGPCDGAIDSTELTISTPATAEPGGPYTICSSDIANIEVITTPGQGSWSGGLGDFGTPASATTTYTPAAQESATTVVLTWTTVDPDGDGPCLPVDTQVTINVLEEAIALAGGPYATCGAQPTLLSATTNGTGTWTGGNGSFENPLDPTTVYTPSVDEVGSTITLQWETFDPDGDGPCDGAIDSTELTISTPATAEPGGPYTICSSDIANIEVITTPGQGTWSGGLGDFGTPASATTTYTPAAQESATTVVLTWTTIDPDGDGPCLPVNTQVTVNVLEEATATLNGPFNVCANATVELSVSSNGEGEWAISPSNVGTISDANLFSPVFTPNVDLFSNSEITIIWTTFDPDGDGPCTAFTTSETVTIYAIPEVNIESEFFIDCGDEISGLVSGGAGGDYTYEWSPQNGIVSPQSNPTAVNASGQYTLNVTDSNNCQNSASTVVSINDLDQMASANNVSVCQFEEVTLQGEALLGLPPFTYQWTPQNYLTPATGLGASVTFSFEEPLPADSVFVLTLLVTDSNGCADTEEVEVLVHPIPQVNAGQDFGLCQDAEAQQLTGYSPLESEGQNAFWSPSNLVDPAQLSVGLNVYEYNFTDNNGCSNSDVISVTIHEVPVASFSFPPLVCEGETVNFISTSLCNTCGPLEQTWSFGAVDEASGQNVSYSFGQTGSVDITLDVNSSFGCADQITETIQIIALPQTSFILSENSVCGPVDILLTNSSVAEETNFNWFIDPLGEFNTPQVGTLTFPAAPCDSIYYQILLVGENICGSTIMSDSLLVFSPPQPLFNLSTDTICADLPIEVYNSTICGGETSFTWNFGNGTIINSQDLVISETFTTGTGFSTYPVTLTGENQCGVIEVTQEVVVVPNVINAFFNANPVFGCEPLVVDFDQEMFGVTFFSWDFGDGVTSAEEDPTHTYNSPGQFTATFVAGNFCGALDSASQQITVLPAPNISFIIEDLFLCVGQSTNFTPLGDPISGHSWSFGDGNTSNLTTPSYAYSDEGFFEVTLSGVSTVNGCTGTTTEIIEVITTPVASISVEQSAGCPPFQVTFENTTTNAVNYFWNLGDGNMFVGDSLTHSFQETGTYDVEVIAINSNSCADTTIVQITVYPQPIADFEYESFDNDQFLDVDFDNLSINAVAYQWNFDDGNSSFLTNPFHSYQKTGDCIYRPQLVAFNTFNCTDTAYRVINIPLEMRVWAPNAFTPDGDGVNDIFSIVTTDVNPLESRLAIFNRWGVLIHEDVGINPSWDGYINNKLAKNDVYIWKYFGREKCGMTEVQHMGHVTLVR